MESTSDRRGRGRPTLAKPDRHDHRLQVGLTAETLAKLTESARARGQRVGAYAREILERAVDGATWIACRFATSGDNQPEPSDVTPQAPAKPEIRQTPTKPPADPVQTPPRPPSSSSAADRRKKT